jgi:hypothetical protein
MAELTAYFRKKSLFFTSIMPTSFEFRPKFTSFGQNLRVSAKRTNEQHASMASFGRQNRNIYGVSRPKIMKQIDDLNYKKFFKNFLSVGQSLCL